MVYNGNGNLRLATYERILFGLLAFMSVVATGLASWALLKIVDHGEQLAGLQQWKQTQTGGGPP